MKAIKIDSKDNVAVVLGAVEKGWEVVWTKDSETASVQAMDTIPMYHKIAVRDIPAGEPVVKYGEHIGQATAFIPAGAHVHVHNVVSMKEDRRGKE